MSGVLCYLSQERFLACKSDLMGYSIPKTTSNSKSKIMAQQNGVKIYDNWVNRLVLGVQLDKRALHVRAELPKHRTETLKQFQMDDVLRMGYHDYALNRNKMGAGKTIEFISLCKYLNSGSVLLICPKPTMAQWVAQFKHWWPERADDVVSVDNVSIARRINDKRHPIVIMNYEKLLNSIIYNHVSRTVWDMMGCDEAHRIKNRNAKTTQAVKSINALRKNAMTGTPVLRNPDDLYSILHWLNPEITGGSYWNFTEYFCNVQEGFFGKQINGLTENPHHIKVLQQILDEVSVYNDIEVAQGKQQITVPIAMESKQRNLYNTIRKILLDELPNTVTIPNGAVLLTRLLQTTSCPRVLNGRVNDKDKDYGVGAKFEWIVGMLESDPELKVVVYSMYEKVISQLQEYLDYSEIGCATYTGKNSTAINESNKQKFIKSSECRVLAGTIGSLGTGVDGLQSVCNVCVFIDRDTRPEINKQAEDRLHRSGQQHEVLCYYLECDKTADQKISRINLTRTEDIKKLLEVKA